MDELICIAREILDEIRIMNSRLDDIRGFGTSSIEDVCDKLDDIRGSSLYSIDDVCNKLDEVSDGIAAVRGSGIFDSLTDVWNKIDDLETTIKLGSNY